MKFEKRKKNLMREFQSSHDFKTSFVCLVCRQTISDRRYYKCEELMIEHIVCEHPECCHKCNVCLELFTSKKHLNTHRCTIKNQIEIEN